LSSHFRKWYPESSNFKKAVPFDLILTPGHLLHWFLDDGFSYVRKGYGRRSKQVLIAFCSESFSREDQQRLCEQMGSKFGIKARVSKAQWGTGWRIFLPQSQAGAFYDVIGSAPVESLAYKWK